MNSLLLQGLTMHTNQPIWCSWQRFISTTPFQLLKNKDRLALFPYRTRLESAHQTRRVLSWHGQESNLKSPRCSVTSAAPGHFAAKAVGSNWSRYNTVRCLLQSHARVVCTSWLCSRRSSVINPRCSRKTLSTVQLWFEIQSLEYTIYISEEENRIKAFAPLPIIWCPDFFWSLSWHRTLTPHR